jgi:L-threonylcarbamoyladenylate synthase
MVTNNYKTEIDKALRSLNRTTGTVVVPTDTTYGIICRLDRPLAISRIYEIKGRDKSKPLIILGADSNDLLEWVTGDLTLPMVLAERFWPGPLTIVARAAEAVPPGILSGGTTVGLRVPNHQATRELLSKFPRGSVASTSANTTGGGAPAKFDQVYNSMNERVDYIMPACGKEPAGIESTIIDVSGDEPVILRQGALDATLIWDCISELGRR